MPCLRFSYKRHACALRRSTLNSQFRPLPWGCSASCSHRVDLVCIRLKRREGVTAAVSRPCKMSRIGVLFLTMLAGHVRGQSNYNAVQCNVDYTAAYMSMLHGSCQHAVQQGGCVPECQALIDTVVEDCHNGTYNDTDPGTGLTSEHSFLQRAIQTLQHLGPDDCDYHAGYSSCSPECTMAHITGGSDLSDFEQHRCIDVDPESGQSAPEAVFHSCVAMLYPS